MLPHATFFQLLKRESFRAPQKDVPHMTSTFRRRTEGQQYKQGIHVQLLPLPCRDSAQKKGARAMAQPYMMIALYGWVKASNHGSLQRSTHVQA